MTNSSLVLLQLCGHEVCDVASRVCLDHGNNTNFAHGAPDSGVPRHENLYSSHPFYMEIRDGRAHGVVSQFTTHSCLKLAFAVKHMRHSSAIP